MSLITVTAWFLVVFSGQEQSVLPAAFSSEAVCSGVRRELSEKKHITARCISGDYILQGHKL